jgi:hypothetical protein
MGYEDEDRDMSEAGETDRTMTPRRAALIVGSLVVSWCLIAAISLALISWAGNIRSVIHE